MLCVAWVAGWWAVLPVYRYVEGRIDRAITEALHGRAVYQPVIHETTAAFMLKFKLSFYIALIVALPYIVLQVWGFVAPALKDNEQKPFKRLAPLSVLLFLIGAGFAWSIVPSAFGWFASYVEDFPGVNINQEAGSQVFLVAKMLLAFGVAFQLPLIVYGIGMAGLLSADTLLKYWRHGATGIFILSMLITPSQDPVSMLMMAIPLTILFIGSVYAVKFMQGKKARLAAEEDVPMTALAVSEPTAGYGEPIVSNGETDDEKLTS